MQFITKSRYARNDELIERIRTALSPDLLKPGYEGAHPMQGHCYVATEAYYHLMGGPHSGLKPKRMKVGDVVHWWLEEPDGTVIDPTHDQFDNEVDYSQGRGGGFLTAQPSKRTQTLMTRIAKLSYEDDDYYEEDESDSWYSNFLSRWVWDETKGELHVWGVDPRDFEYKTHLDKIRELGGGARWEFDLGYFTRDGVEGAYAAPREVREYLGKIQAEGTNPTDPDELQIIPIEVRKLVGKTAGTYLDAYCYFDGQLYIASHHHAAIVEKLIEEQGYDWDDIENLPSLFGWLQHTDHQTGLPLDHIRVGFHTGLGLFRENEDRAREEAFLKKALEAIGEYYKREAVTSPAPDMYVWQYGNEEQRVEDDKYYLRQSSATTLYQMTEANYREATRPEDSWFIKFVYVPQADELRWWYAEGYYGYPHHYDGIQQTMEDYGHDYDDAEDYQTGFYASWPDTGYDVGMTMYQDEPLTKEYIEGLLQPAIAKMTGEPE